MADAAALKPITVAKPPVPVVVPMVPQEYQPPSTTVEPVSDSGLLPPAMENGKAWVPQENAAYEQMSRMLLAGLRTFEMETAANGKILEVTGTLAGRVRSQLEAAAWQAWTAKMNAALAYARGIVSPVLSERSRGLTASYQHMNASIADAWAEFNQWMSLASSAVESITGPAQQVYDERQAAASTAMLAVCTDAKNTYERMFNPARQMENMINVSADRMGTPPTA